MIEAEFGPGEAASPAWDTRGWSSAANRAAVLTIYRQVLDSDQLARLDAAPAESVRGGGWAKGPLDAADIEATLARLISEACAYWWWRRPAAGFEPLDDRAVTRNGSRRLSLTVFVHGPPLR